MQQRTQKFFTTKITKLLKLLLKIVVSGLAVYYVVSKLEFNEMITTIKSATIWLLPVALMIYAGSQYFAAERLNCLFKRININLSKLENIKLYWLGLFYNLFLPGGVGGDGYKIYFLEKYLKTGIKKTLGAILTDRVSGLAVIAIFLAFFSYFINYELPRLNLIWVSIPLKNLLWILIPLAIICFYLFIRVVNISLFGAFFPVLGRAFVVQILQMLTALVILLSLNSGGSENIGNYLFLFFLSAVMGSIPITLGGIGVREATFIWGAQYLGIDPNTAVALSLLFYAASAITALPGIYYTIKPAKILKLQGSNKKVTPE